jgi:hypothetical protein
LLQTWTPGREPETEDFKAMWQKLKVGYDEGDKQFRIAKGQYYKASFKPGEEKVSRAVVDAQLKKDLQFEWDNEWSVKGAGATWRNQRETLGRVFRQKCENTAKATIFAAWAQKHSKHSVVAEHAFASVTGHDPAIPADRRQMQQWEVDLWERAG